MKSSMDLTLSNSPKNTTTETIIRFINELVDCLVVEKKSKNTLSGIKNRQSSLDEFSACLKLRKDRKDFSELIAQFLKDFDSLSEEQQADIEMHFFDAIKKLEALVPIANSKLTEGRFSLISRIDKRELLKTLNVFKSAQKIMADSLYPDHSNEILSTPAQYQQLVDAWSGIPYDEE